MCTKFRASTLLVVLTLLTILTIAPTTAQDYSDECEQLRNLQEEMQEKADTADSVEERREIMQNYRDETEGLVEKCSEYVETGENSTEQQNDEENTSDTYTASDYSFELAEGQFEDLKERMIENITEARQNPSEHFPDDCIEEGKEQITNYRGNISDTDSMEQIKEINSKFQEKKDSLRDNCETEQGERPQKQESTLENSSALDVELPEPGETVTQEQVSDMRNRFRNMSQQVQDLRERNQELTQRIQNLQGNSSEKTDEPGRSQKSEPAGNETAEGEEKSQTPQTDDNGNSSEENNNGGLLNRVAKFFFG